MLISKIIFINIQQLALLVKYQNINMLHIFLVVNHCCNAYIPLCKSCIYGFLLYILRKYFIYSQYFPFKRLYLFFVKVYCCKFAFVIPKSLFIDLYNHVLKSKNANQ